MKIPVILFIAICSQSLGEVYLTRGMKAIGEVDTLNLAILLQTGIEVFSTPYIWLGIFLLLIFFGLFLSALSWADLSYVLPMTAFYYVINALLSWQLLGEHISPVRWFGTMMICVGVAVVSRTEAKDEG